jgi:hypothetical protein
VRRATNVWTRFLDQHPVRASIALFGVPTLVIAAFVILRFI